MCVRSVVAFAVLGTVEMLLVCPMISRVASKFDIKTVNIAACIVCIVVLADIAIGYTKLF